MCSLNLLSKTDTEYQRIISDFNLPLSSYAIHSILKIDMEWYISSRYETILSWSWKKPEVNRLFHGTRHACNVWELDDPSKMCNNPDCGNANLLLPCFR